MSTDGVFLSASSHEFIHDHEAPDGDLPRPIQGTHRCTISSCSFHTVRRHTGCTEQYRLTPARMHPSIKPTSRVSASLLDRRYSTRTPPTIRPTSRLGRPVKLMGEQMTTQTPNCCRHRPSVIPSSRHSRIRVTAELGRSRILNLPDMVDGSPISRNRRPL
jgi:hypothetical protein